LSCVTIDSETATFSVYHGAGVGGGGTIIMVSICCCLLRCHMRRACATCREEPPYRQYVQLSVEEGEDTSGKEQEGTHNSLPDIHFICILLYYR